MNPVALLVLEVRVAVKPKSVSLEAKQSRKVGIRLVVVVPKGLRQ